MKTEPLIRRTDIRYMTTSRYYSRGKAYYETGHVKSLTPHDEKLNQWSATVRGSRTYDVEVDFDDDGFLSVECSCPAFDPADTCKHTIAVLMAISDATSDSESVERLRRMVPANHAAAPARTTPSATDLAADGAISKTQAQAQGMSNSQPPLTSQRETAKPADDRARQLIQLFHSTQRAAQFTEPGVENHGGTREYLTVEYICHPFAWTYDSSISIEIKVGPKNTYVVKKIRDFLNDVALRRTTFFTPKFSYNPVVHSFQSPDSEIIQALIEVAQEQSLYNRLTGTYATSHSPNERWLHIPPSAWKGLYPLLLQAHATVVNEHSSEPMLGSTTQLTHGNADQLGNEATAAPHLPISAQVTARGDGVYALQLQGLDNVQLFPNYGCALVGGTFYPLDDASIHQLKSMKEITAFKQENVIEIPPGAINAFVNDVVPGLKRMGRLELDETIAQRIVEAPLRAKVYLDWRSGNGNRHTADALTARLEWVYGDVAIDPLARTQLRVATERSAAGTPSQAAAQTAAAIDTIALDSATLHAHRPDEPTLDAAASGASLVPTSRNPQIIMRDAAKEARVLRFLTDSGFAAEGVRLTLSDETQMYNFLFKQLSTLEEWAEVYATTAIDSHVKSPQTGTHSRVEMNTKTNWLEVSFDIEGIDQGEMMGVLESLIEKKPYHRLKSGAFVSLEDGQFADLAALFDGLAIQPGDLRDFKRQLSARRSGAEDETLVQGAGTHGNAFSSPAHGTSEDAESSSIHLQLPAIRALPLMDVSTAASSVKFGKGLRRWLDNLRNPDNLDIEVPADLHATLREYQTFGFQWMKTLATYGFGGVLADDMGLGKTIQSIAYLLSNRVESAQSEASRAVRQKANVDGQKSNADNQGVEAEIEGTNAELEAVRPSPRDPSLIVCPSSLTYNWLREIERFAPTLRAAVVAGERADRLHILSTAHKFDVIITSYPLLRRDIASYAGIHFSTLILDEAQAVKNRGTQTANVVSSIQSDYRFALTGTPVENSLDDLWSIFHVIFPELLGGHKAFSGLSAEAVARRVKPFVLRRLKRDVLKELPEKIETVQTAELTRDQKKLYLAYLTKLQEETKQGLAAEGFQKGRFRILAGLTRLRQICCHPALCVENYRGGAGKLEQLLELVDSCQAANQRMLVFSQFTSMLDIIRQEMTKRRIDYFYLDGQTPSKERLDLCQRFNEGTVPVFLISLKAGGTGLNLTGADTVILYDLWWNPAVEEQAADRAHRIGQKKTVQVIRLITEGTIEEKIYELQAHKRDLIDTVVQANDEGLGALTEADVRELLMI